MLMLDVASNKKSLAWIKLIGHPFDSALLPRLLKMAALPNVWKERLT
jgi:hypothetical protein